MSKPGVVVYFDIRPCIARLSLSEKGQLFDAILDYAENGVEPEIDGGLGVAWDFIRPRIDKDSARYARKVESNQYAVFTRELKKRGLEPVSRDVWESMTSIERERTMSCDNDNVSEPSYDIARHPTNNLQLTTILSSELGAAKPDKPESEKRTKKVFPPDSDAYMAACCLRDEIAARLPTASPPSEKQLQAWAGSFDKCHRLDGHDWSEIERVLLFSQDDPFWQKNILSGEKFRKQYTLLLARMGGG